MSNPISIPRSASSRYAIEERLNPRLLPWIGRRTDRWRTGRAAIARWLDRRAAGRGVKARTAPRAASPSKVLDLVAGLTRRHQRFEVRQRASVSKEQTVEHEPWLCRIFEGKKMLVVAQSAMLVPDKYERLGLTR